MCCTQFNLSLLLVNLTNFIFQIVNKYGIKQSLPWCNFDSICHANLSATEIVASLLWKWPSTIEDIFGGRFFVLFYFYFFNRPPLSKLSNVRLIWASGIPLKGLSCMRQRESAVALANQTIWPVWLLLCVLGCWVPRMHIVKSTWNLTVQVPMNTCTCEMKLFACDYVVFWHKCQSIEQISPGHKTAYNPPDEIVFIIWEWGTVIPNYFQNSLVEPLDSTKESRYHYYLEIIIIIMIYNNISLYHNISQ